MVVVDISNSNNAISCDDVIWVDTNVLLWYFYYPTANITRNNTQTRIYPTFISDALASGCRVHTTIYNVSEMINVIEKNEYDIHCELNGLDKEIYHFKKFRNNKCTRSVLKAKLSNVFLQMNQIVLIDEFGYGMDEINKYLNKYCKMRMDFFDYIMLKHIEIGEEVKLVTDDIDFLYKDTSITAYTANQRFISKAKLFNLKVNQ